MKPSTPPTPEAALAAMVAALEPVLHLTEHVPAAGAGGRFLVCPVSAERDQPPFDRVMMDGIAVRAAALQAGQRTFRCAGLAAAGHAAPPLELDSDAIEVMTGAMLPSGADAILPIEELTRTAEHFTVNEPAATTASSGLNIHRRGSDCQEGACVLPAPRRLSPIDIAIATGAGAATLQVRCATRIAVISTGDELVEAGTAIAPWQVRRSNAHAVRAALVAAGYACVTDHHLPDDLPAMQTALAALLATHEVLVLSGGVSMGQFDHVPAALRSLAVTEVLHRIAQRPGQPLWFGRGPQGQAVFGLPGNPVSTFVCAVRYVLPVLARLSGLPALENRALVALAAPARALPGVTRFLPVRLAAAEQGLLLATPQPPANSGDFLSLLDTSGMVALPAATTPWPAGTVVAYWPWPGQSYLPAQA